MNIREFLEARIAEDEKAAELGGYHNGSGVYARDNYGCLMVQPSRVRAECEAKRTIIERWADLGRGPLKGEPGLCGMYAALGEVLLDFAAVYRDHPDFDPDWG